MMKYCSNCGTLLKFRIPEGDDRPRFICDGCQKIYYENPKCVVGCIPEWENKILLCRRAIKPCYGKWTLPAGYLENGETMANGAKRETFEEAYAKVDNLTPYALFNLVFINQIYLLFRACLMDLHYKPGKESLDVRLFTEKQIPWHDLAFPVIRETLRWYFKDCSKGVFPVQMGDIEPIKLD